MTAQELKNSILQLAIQGKLVPQDPNDEPATVLLEKIKEERNKLIKEKKIKKEKYSEIYKDETDNHYYEKFEDGTINDITDEIPFDIPGSWRFVRLNNISNIFTGFSFKGTELKENKAIRVIRISDFDENGLKDSKIVRIDENAKFDNYIIENNSILLAMTGGTVGKCYLLSNLNEKLYLNQRVASIYSRYNEILIKYIYYFMQSPFMKEIINTNKNSTNDNISMELINNFIVPLPPFNEQNRVVNKIINFDLLFYKYNDTYNQLDKLNNSYKEELQKSILQYAIQGKLVSQNPDDESADMLIQNILNEKRKLIKEKQIKKENLSVIYKDSTDNQFYEKFDDGTIVNITDEIPFEIPGNWCWARMKNVIDVRDGTHDTPTYISNGYPLITGKDFYYGTFEFSKTQYISKEDYLNISNRSKVEINDILFSMIGGNIGSMIRITKENYFEMAIKNVALFKQYINNDYLSLYLYYFLKSQVENFKNIAKGGAQAFVPLNKFRNYLYPVPPLKEQEQIVKKLNTILSCINADN